MQALSIKVKALVIFIVSITLVAALSLVVVIYKSYQLASKQSSDQKELILSMNQNELKTHTYMAEKAINAFYEASSSEANIAQNIKADALILKKTLDDIYTNNKDRLSKDELRTMLLALINGYRYNNDVGYFYAYNLEGVNVVHPINKALVGKNLIDMKDKEGNFVIKDILKSAKEGTGVTKFIWPHPVTKQDEPKLSYNFYYEPLDIVIGTGDTMHLVSKSTSKVKPSKYSINYVTPKMMKDTFLRIKKHPMENTSMPFMQPNQSFKVKRLSLKNPILKENLSVKSLLMEPLKTKAKAYFVTYNYENPVTKKDATKLTYAKYFKEWDWVIVSGVYIDGIEEFTQNERHKISSNINSMLLETVLLGGFVTNTSHYRYLFLDYKPYRKTSSQSPRYGL